MSTRRELIGLSDGAAAILIHFRKSMRAARPQKRAAVSYATATWVDCPTLMPQPHRFRRRKKVLDKSRPHQTTSTSTKFNEAFRLSLKSFIRDLDLDR